MNNGIITNFTGHLLLATDSLKYSYFEKAVIFICSHNNEEGAMGLVLNSPLPATNFENLCDDLDIEQISNASPTILSGGPVEPNRGFVLHGTDYNHKLTVPVTDDIMLSATTDVIEATAKGTGPVSQNLCLGYSGWEPGQLESEIFEDSWMLVPASRALLFETPIEHRYEAAMASVGLVGSSMMTSALA
ncbi:MAG: YqgE/AlgH family protein [Pseudomonadota bacterium]|nr:YqgE/AlgH family protein [Pseudomonadota bacterium]